MEPRPRNGSDAQLRGSNCCSKCRVSSLIPGVPRRTSHSVTMETLSPDCFNCVNKLNARQQTGSYGIFKRYTELVTLRVLRD